MMRSCVHLIGGGPGTLGSLRAHLKGALASVVAKGKPLVAYVGAASGDDAGFQRMIGAEIVRAGGRVEGVKLASSRARVGTAERVLEDCDVVFVSGGDVDAGMSVLTARGVLPLFHRLGREGRPMIGISAGSIMLGLAWVRFPDEDHEAKHPSKRPGGPALFPCMGIAPVYVDAHAEEDRWAELRVLVRLLAASGVPNPIAYGLTREGGVWIEPSGAGSKVIAFGGPAPRFRFRGGRVVAGSPLAEGKSDVARVRHPPPRRPLPVG